MCGEAQTKHCNTYKYSSWGRFVLTGMTCIPSEIPSEKLFFLWYQSVGGSFGARMGAYVYFPSQHLDSIWLRLVQTCADSAATTSDFMCISLCCCVLKAMFL